MCCGVSCKFVKGTQSIDVPKCCFFCFLFLCVCGVFVFLFLCVCGVFVFLFLCVWVFLFFCCCFVSLFYGTRSIDVKKCCFFFVFCFFVFRCFCFVVFGVFVVVVLFLCFMDTINWCSKVLFFLCFLFLCVLWTQSIDVPKCCFFFVFCFFVFYGHNQLMFQSVVFSLFFVSLCLGVFFLLFSVFLLLLFCFFVLWGFSLCFILFDRWFRGLSVTQSPLIQRVHKILICR